MLQNISARASEAHSPRVWAQVADDDSVADGREGLLEDYDGDNAGGAPYRSSLDETLLQHACGAQQRRRGTDFDRTYLAIRRSWMKRNARGSRFRMDEMTMERWMLVWVSVMLVVVSLMSVLTAAHLPRHRSSGLVTDDMDSSTTLQGASSNKALSTSPTTWRDRSAALHDIATVLRHEVAGAMTLATTPQSSVTKMISTLLNPPPTIEAMENGMLWCGIAAFAVGAMGVWHAWGRNRQVLKVYLLPCCLVGLIALGYLIHATLHGYVTGDIRGVTKDVHEAWTKLGLSVNGVQALHVLSGRLSCTGYDTCCATNTTSVTFRPDTGTHGDYFDDDQDDAINEVDATWDGVCFATLPNGTLVNQTGGNITARVQQQCSYMMQGSADSDASYRTFTTPCARHLLGRVTTSLSFALVTLLTTAAFCFVNSYLSLVILNEA